MNRPIPKDARHRVDWPAIGPSPALSLDPKSRLALRDHFAEAIDGHSRYRLARLGVSSDYHVEELVTQVHDWLQTDDFANYDPTFQGRVRRFRYYLRSTIEHMALHLRRDLLRGILPTQLRNRFTHYYLRLRGGDKLGRTPELTPEEAHQLRLEALHTYLSTKCTDSERELIETLTMLSLDESFSFDPHTITQELARVTCKSHGAIRTLRSRLSTKVGLIYSDRVEQFLG